MFPQDMLVKPDQNAYRKAVLAVTGLTSLKTAKILREIIEEYHKPIDRDLAAKELGITVKEFQKICSNSDRVALVRLGVGLTIRRELWEEIFNSIPLADK